MRIFGGYGELHSDGVLFDHVSRRFHLRVVVQVT